MVPPILAIDQKHVRLQNADGATFLLVKFVVNDTVRVVHRAVLLPQLLHERL